MRGAGGRSRWVPWMMAVALAPGPTWGLTPAARGRDGVTVAHAFQRIVPLSSPTSRGRGRPRPWARLATHGRPLVWCGSGGRGGRRLLVILPGGRRRRCAGVRVTSRGAGGRGVTWLGLRRGSFWARPLGAARGVVVRALGARGVFQRVSLTIRDGRLVVAAGVRAPGARARYRLTIFGRRVVHMRVIETAFSAQASTARRDRAALAGFYDYGIGAAMPAQAIDPARHDADGLWLSDRQGHSWVPLRNPHRLWSQVYGPGVRAFGLLQRDRARRYYGVHAAREQDAPDVIVHWPGRGTRLVLRERPATGRGAPNVWLLFGPRAPGEATRRYHLTWTRTPKRSAERAIVVSTLMGGNVRTGARMYVIDYAGGVIARRLPEGVVTGEVRLHPDTFILQNTVRYNPYTRGYRQVLQVLPVAGARVHVRAWLSVWGARVSETWRYTLRAPRIAH